MDQTVNERMGKMEGVNSMLFKQFDMLRNELAGKVETGDVKKELITEAGYQQTLKEKPSKGHESEAFEDAEELQENQATHTKIKWLTSRGNLGRYLYIEDYLRRANQLKFTGKPATLEERRNLRDVIARPERLGELVDFKTLKKFELQMKTYFDLTRIPEEDRFLLVIGNVGYEDGNTLMELKEDRELANASKEEKKKIPELTFADALMILEHKHSIARDSDELVEELNSGRLSIIWKDVIAWVHEVKQIYTKFDDSFPAPGERMRLLRKACRSNRDIYVKLTDAGFFDQGRSHVTIANVQDAMKLIEDAARTLAEVEEGQSIKRKRLEQKKILKETENLKSDTKRLNTISEPKKMEKKTKEKTLNPHIVCDSCQEIGHTAFMTICKNYHLKGTPDWWSVVMKNREIRREKRTVE